VRDEEGDLKQGNSMSIKRIAKQGREEGRNPSPTMDNSGGQQWLSGRGATARAQVSACGDAKPARVGKKEGVQGLSTVLIEQGKGEEEAAAVLMAMGRRRPHSKRLGRVKGKLTRIKGGN
jgi:hypothetical protein